MPVFAEDVVDRRPAGKYRFLATFERGAAAAGGEAEFYVTDPAEMPPVETEVVLWGDDPELGQVACRARHPHAARSPPAAPSRARGDPGLAASRRRRAARPRLRDLARRIARGSTVVFLSPAVFAEGEQPTGLAAAGQQGDARRAALVALSQGRMGQAASDLRRPARPAG